MLTGLLGLGVLATWAPDARAGLPLEVDCEPEITDIQVFSPGSGALRNTSTDGAETRGSDETKTITVVARLGSGASGTCPSTETRVVSVTLEATNNVGGDGPALPEPLLAKPLSGGEFARFRFDVFYGAGSCAGGEGPVPKDQGGEDQVNEDAFTFEATATYPEFDPAPADPGPNQDVASADATLICKPSRTTQ